MLKRDYIPITASNPVSHTWNSMSLYDRNEKLQGNF